MNNFVFTPINGLLDSSAFPTNPATEQAARQQIQTPLNQIRDFINSNITSFFSNGGEVTGSITTTKTLASRNVVATREFDNYNGYPAVAEKVSDGTLTTGLAVLLGKGDGSGYNDNYVRPLDNGLTNLGSANFPFKDIYANGVLKAPNGYTKLTNGFTKQWGTYVSSGINANSNLSVTVTLPVTFSNSNVSVVFQTLDTKVGAGTVEAKVIYKRLTKTASGFTVILNSDLYVDSVTFGWEAFGY